jgi:hypothetical protein
LSRLAIRGPWAVEILLVSTSGSFARRAEAISGVIFFVLAQRKAITFCATSSLAIPSITNLPVLSIAISPVGFLPQFLANFDIAAKNYEYQANIDDCDNRHEKGTPARNK